MAKVKVSGSPSSSSPMRPALTPEARESQCISLAYDLAEQQLRDGTASSQVISHFLKQGTEKERLERVKIERENILLAAKAEALESAKRVEELYADAITAMKTYSGASGDDNEDDY